MKRTVRENDGDDYAQRRGEAGVGAYFIHKFLVDDHGQRGIALADEPGGTEVRQGRHEHHQAAGEYGGHDDGQRHLADAPESGHAQIFAGLLQGGINAAQRGGYIQVNHRKELERKHQ